MRKADYARSVFLNCPFDDSYAPLFEAAVFAVMDCGFHVRCAKESSDASHVRIHKIYELIRSSRLGIHDLSRTELDSSTDLPRFNMPLELGIFLGAKYLGDEQQRRKECLIFDKERYRYQKYVSDVAGQDIATHNNDARTLIARIRDWLASITDSAVPGGAILWDRYQRFRSELPETSRRQRQSPEELTFAEYVRYVDAFRPSKDDALIIDGERKIKNPTPAQIRQELKGLGGDNSFAIYEKSGSGLSFMQTAGGPDEGFVLEYQAGSVDSHFACTNTALSVEEVVQAFVWYATGDDRWRSELPWEPIEV
jgi:hypothetical protein